MLTALLIYGLVRWLRRRGRVVASTSLDGVNIRDITDTLMKNPNEHYTTRHLNQIDKIIIHHSGTTSGSPESYARHHVETRGWPGIGYHYVIQKDGTIYQTNRWETVSYHTSGQNTGSIGVCLTGNYNTQQPPQAQMNAAAKLVRYLRNNIQQGLMLNQHRQYQQTSCPGANLDLDAIDRLSA